MDAPVGLIEVFVNARFDVDHGAGVVAQTGVLAAVGDIRARGLEVMQGKQGFFDRILDQFDRRRDVVGQLRYHQLRQLFGLVSVKLTRGGPRLGQGLGDLAGIERCNAAITFQNILGLPTHHHSSSSRLLLRHNILCCLHSYYTKCCVLDSGQITENAPQFLPSLSPDLSTAGG
jgi:hypothetical protein